MSFNTAAKTWDDDPSKVERSYKLAQVLKSFFGNRKFNNALEFGCGTGLLSFAMTEAFSNVDLADTSTGMIEVLSQKIEQSSLKHFNPIILTEDTQLKSNAYDIIYTLLTMHHIADLDTVFQDFSRILKAGGLLCIADLVKEDGDFHNAEDTKHVHHGFDRETMVTNLNKFGFLFVDYQVFHTIEKKTEAGQLKQFPLFLLIMKKE